MYSKQDNSFHHYDSLSPHNYNTAKSLAGNIEPFLEGELCYSTSSIHR